MSNGQPEVKWMPTIPVKSLFRHKKLTFKKGKIVSKIALGVLLLSFFINYQPAFTFPPIKKNLAQAQTFEQVQTITPDSLPFTFQLPHPGYMSTPFTSYHPGIDIA